jgi:glucose-1-phosphate adenylyltransferase
VLALVLAGGRGERLRPLTDDRSKPAVPFGGKYRIIDFVLSSLVHSGITAIHVLTQYKAQSLLDHLQRAWIHSRTPEDFLTAVPAQMQAGKQWYRGTADAIYQNLRLLDRTRPEMVAVFGADHVYKMNVRQMIDFHQSREAGVTVACMPVPKEDASAFGIIEVDEQWRICGFKEKPANPLTIPGQPGMCLASMGNYIFDRNLMVELLQEDAKNPDSEHDFGKSILPKLVDTVPLYAYDFNRNEIPTEEDAESSYWRDIGTLDAYFEANLDLKNVQPRLNLYNAAWPIRTASYGEPPVKFVFDEDGRRGRAVQSILTGGCIVAGGYVKDSVLGRNVTVDARSEILECVIMDNVHVGADCRIRRTIIDKNNHIRDGSTIGYDLVEDAKKYTVSEGGVVVVARAKDSPENCAWNRI